VNCDETRALMGGYSDGELDLVRTTEMEQHFDICPVCRREWQRLQALRAALSNRSLYHHAPDSLRRQIQQALRREERRTAPFRLASLLPEFRAPGIAATATLAAAAFLAGNRFHPFSVPARQPGEDPVTQEVVSSHVRSLMADHLMDVASSDRHTVKPWFSGKLDFAPPVEDLADRDFPLIGGRLDAIGGQPVAALVYRHRKHIINLFIWPSAAPSAAVREGTQRGYHTLTWSQSGMTYWAISDMNAGDLRAFAQELQRRIAAP